MEGNGPGSRDPVDMGVLLLSTDPVALDSVFCHLVHLKPSDGSNELPWRKDGAWNLEKRGD